MGNKTTIDIDEQGNASIRGSLLGVQNFLNPARMTGPITRPQGDNPIPDYTGGKPIQGLLGGIGTAVPENMQGQFGKYYFTNRPSQNEGLLNSMNVNPELINSAKTAPPTQAIPKTREEAMKVGFEEFVKQTGLDASKAWPIFKQRLVPVIANAFPEQKAYQPKTQEEALDFEKKKKETELSMLETKAYEQQKGKEKAKFEANEPKARNTLTALNRQWDVVDEQLDRAINSISWNTAGVGGVLKNLPATDARTLDGILTSIKANIGFDKLQQMRADSPTGGALGQVSDFENKLLQAVQGSLDQLQSGRVLKKNLEAIKRNLAGLREEKNNAFNQDYKNVTQPNTTSSGNRFTIKEK